jgi:hypothetical protein
MDLELLNAGVGERMLGAGRMEWVQMDLLSLVRHCLHYHLPVC